MKTIDEIKEIIKKNKRELMNEFDLSEIGVFGSYAKGEQDEESDLDILVELKRPVGLFKFIQLENHLSEILGVKVDLVRKKALKPYIGKQILREVQYV